MNRLLRIMPKLAWADLKHEWILSLCLIIAIAAVLAPLLILMGLKHGTIAGLRQELVEDPAYREIKPAQTQEYSPAWFERWQSKPEVQFLIPTILPASSIIQAIDAQGKPQLLDLIPSAAGDPLLEQNGLAAPQAGECVLTRAAAQLLGVTAGQSLSLQATRRQKGKVEYGRLDCRIIGILPVKAGNLPRIYTALDFVQAVEKYKEGVAVPEYGWPGSVPKPYPSYDAILVLMPKALNPLLHNALLIESGLADIRALDEAEQKQRLGWSQPGWSVYELSIPRGKIHYDSYRAVKSKLRGQGAIVLPWVAPLPLEIGGQSLRVRGLSLSAKQARKLGREPMPWGGLQKNPRADHLLQVVLEQAQPAPLKAHFAGKQDLDFVFKKVHSGQGDWIPLELAAILNTAKERAVQFENGQFILQQAGYRGFRLYARSIDDVPSLADQLQAEGIAIIAEIEKIKRIQILDQGLSQLFWLIATLGLGGAVAVLIASLYAAVERKRKALAMMRLIGFSRRDLFSFPIYEGLFLALGGIILSLLAYAGLSSIINRLFTLPSAQKICYLPDEYIIIAVLATLLIAKLSAFFAAWKATQIDPADAIREE